MLLTKELRVQSLLIWKLRLTEVKQLVQARQSRKGQSLGWHYHPPIWHSSHGCGWLCVYLLFLPPDCELLHKLATMVLAHSLPTVGSTFAECKFGPHDLFNPWFLHHPKLSPLVRHWGASVPCFKKLSTAINLNYNLIQHFMWRSKPHLEFCMEIQL